MDKKELITTQYKPKLMYTTNPSYDKCVIIKYYTTCRRSNITKHKKILTELSGAPVYEKEEFSLQTLC